jgi:hypothetical protein
VTPKTFSTFALISSAVGSFTRGPRYSMFLEQLANNIMPAKAKIVLLFIKKRFLMV